MRPVRLVLDNMMSYTQPTTIDFTYGDLFVITGPTGAGKSTILDAITFALYATMNRARNLADIVSTGRDKASISLIMAIDGRYIQVSRKIEPLKSGGSRTYKGNEVRLQEVTGIDGTPLGEPLATGAKEVNAKIVELIGMDHDAFQRAVILPQHEFATFLHATDDARRTTIKDLLGMSIYDQVFAKISLTKRAYETSAELLTKQLDDYEDHIDLANPTAQVDERLRAAQARLDQHVSQRTHISTAMRRLLAMNKHIKAGIAFKDQVTVVSETLARVPSPSQDATDASQAIQALEATIERLTAGQAKDQAEFRALAEQVQAQAGLEAQVSAYNQARQAAQAHERAQGAHEEAQATLRAATTAQHEADQGAQAALAHLQAIEQADQAQRLASTLHVGDACPVCTQTIPPAGLDHHHAVGSALGEAQREHTSAMAAAKTAHGAMVQAQSREETCAAGLAQAVAALVEAQARLDGLPDEDEVLAQLEAARAAGVAMSQLKAKMAEDLQALAQAQEAKAQHEVQQANALTVITEHLDALLSLRIGRQYDAPGGEIDGGVAGGIGPGGGAGGAAGQQAPTAPAFVLASSDTWQGATLLDSQAWEPFGPRWCLEAYTDCRGLQPKDWQRIYDAAQATHAHQQAMLDAIKASITQTLQRYEELKAQVQAQLHAMDMGHLALDSQVIEDACIQGMREAQGAVSTLEASRSQLLNLVTELRETQEQVELYQSLYKLAGKGAFQSWVMNIVYERIVETANGYINLLSGGMYRFVLDASYSLQVQEVMAGTAMRSIKTLSGGETFIASLALALAVSTSADDLPTMAVQLDTLLIDEGFGTLDMSTLDTVTSAIENLASMGRMVGLITHVPELAQRLPVQYHVAKVDGCSQVTMHFA